jgi:hypothetical protein
MGTKESGSSVGVEEYKYEALTGVEICNGLFAGYNEIT